MQTILTVMRSNKGQTGIVDDYLAGFCARLASDEQAIATSSSAAGEVAFVRDDAYLQFHEGRDQEQPAHLGSFGQLSNDANCRHVIFMNPIILVYRNNGQNLRLCITNTSSEAPEDAESE